MDCRQVGWVLARYTLINFLEGSNRSRGLEASICALAYAAKSFGSGGGEGAGGLAVAASFAFSNARRHQSERAISLTSLIREMG
jgi:hypothetical protein